MNQDHAARLIARLLALRYLPREDKEVRRLLVDAGFRDEVEQRLATSGLRLLAHPFSAYVGVALTRECESARVRAERRLAVQQPRPAQGCGRAANHPVGADHPAKARAPAVRQIGATRRTERDVRDREAHSASARGFARGFPK